MTTNGYYERAEHNRYRTLPKTPNVKLGTRTSMSTMFVGSLGNLNAEKINIELTLAMLTSIPQDIHYSIGHMACKRNRTHFLVKRHIRHSLTDLVDIREGKEIYRLAATSDRRVIALSPKQLAFFLLF